MIIGGNALLVTEIMGSSLRTREAIALGESEHRRLDEIIEAGVVSGWHTFEQSLSKAYEQELITARNRPRPLHQPGQDDPAP